MSRRMNSIPLPAVALLPCSLAASDAVTIVGRLSDGSAPSTRNVCGYPSMAEFAESHARRIEERLSQDRRLREAH